MGDFVHARQDYDEAIRLRPTIATFFRRRGDLRKTQGDLAGAGADLETALRLNPKDVFAYLARGDLAAARHDYDKAFADYDKALAVKPDSRQVASLIYSARSMAAVDMGDVKRALDEYDAVLKIEPDNALYLQGRAFTAFAAGDFAAAAAGFGRAVQKRPGLSYSVIMRYVARSRMGEHDTPELRRNASAFEHNAWPWPLIGLYLGEVTPDEVRASTVQAIGEGAARRKCEATFFLAEYELLHRRRDEAASLMQEAAKSCSSDALERNAAQGEAKRLAP
jgi:lipoprotein NlpI